MQPDLKYIYEAFETEGSFVYGALYGGGHINDTYEVIVDRSGTNARYILQKINHTIFKDVPRLMDNVDRVCRHALSKLEAQGCVDADRRSLRVVPTREGSTFYEDTEGYCWRVYPFIEGATGYNIVEREKQAFEAAKAFGEFQKLLVDMPGGSLHPTIPDFHNTRKRIDSLMEAIAEDRVNRAAGCRGEIDWAMQNQHLASALLDMHEKGLMPERPTHNDTKLNNVLIDSETDEAVCVIDLDTMMPGLALYDFGDLVRSSTNPVSEDETDLNAVKVQVNLFDALVRGYLASARESLTQSELESMPLSGMVLTFECGVRFLTDYLNGDVYFKTKRLDQNIDRCRVQFALARSMMEHEEAMASCVDGALQDF